MTTSQAWTKERLENLVCRYNRLYWRGRLPQLRIVTEGKAESLGLCDWRRRTIIINVAKCRDGREVRSTLLHEMAHVATPTHDKHDISFFAELEHLLQQRAPISVRNPEARQMRLLHGRIPARFPLLQRKMVESKHRWKLERAETSKARRHERYLRTKRLKQQIAQGEKP